MATLLAPLSKCYVNHSWSITEPEVVGMPRWQTGAKAQRSIHWGLQGTNLPDNSPYRVECTAHHPGSGGVAEIVAHTAPVEHKRPGTCYFSTRAGPAEDDPWLYKLGSKPVQAVVLTDRFTSQEHASCMAGRS